MRWPLKYQIMLPMLVVLLATLLAVSGLNAYMVGRRVEEGIRDDLMEVAKTLSNSRFPLTNNVLVTMRGLSGAEFATMTDQGTILATSGGEVGFQELPPVTDRLPLWSWDARRTTTLGGKEYFHVIMPVRESESPSRPDVLHILYSREAYESSVRDAKRFPILIGFVTAFVVAGLAVLISSHLTRPLRRLQEHVGHIASGDFRTLPVTGHQDEITDLSRSINRMAAQLIEYEQNIRRTERLRTLGQLGAGIAHQMRNAVTGCRLALQLHAQDCPVSATDESLSVAGRQLAWMESHLKRFLQLGQSSKPVVRSSLDIVPILESVIGLVGPTAKHLKVGFEAQLPSEPVWVEGDAESLEQAFVNLLLNAVEAVANSPAVSSPDGTRSMERQVRLTLEVSDEKCELQVLDSGAGPGSPLESDLFEPFVTTKPDGVGLGLAVARDSVMAHGGTIHWRREDGWTIFQVDLPRTIPAAIDVR